MATRRFLPFLVLALLAAAPLPAQICEDVGGDDRLIGFTLLSGAVPAAVNCNGLRCYPPLLQGVRYETRPVGCNPHTTVCSVAALIPSVFRGNAQNPGVVTGHTEWHDQNGISAGSCGAAGASIRADRGDSWLVVGGFSCAKPEGLERPGVYSLFTNICAGVCGAPSQTIPIEMTPLAAHRALCGPPPPFGCPEDPPAGTCCLGPGGGTSPAGGGPGASPPGSGPGAHLRYRAGGAGAPGTPGNQPWIAAGLGAGWAHDYAERIVPSSQPNQVWLLTRYATFRSYTDANADGLYETVAPSAEERNGARPHMGLLLERLRFDPNPAAGRHGLALRVRRLAPSQSSHLDDPGGHGRRRAGGRGLGVRRPAQRDPHLAGRGRLHRSRRRRHLGARLRRSGPAGRG